jgi:hypothetical protein
MGRNFSIIVIGGNEEGKTSPGKNKILLQNSEIWKHMTFPCMKKVVREEATGLETINVGWKL